MRQFHTTRSSNALMSVPVALLALVAFGCSGPDAQQLEEILAATSGSGDQGAQPAPSVSGASGNGDAGSPIAPAVGPDAVGPGSDAGPALNTTPPPDPGAQVADAAPATPPNPVTPMPEAAPPPNPAAPMPPATASPSPVPAPSAAGLSLRVAGNHLVDASSTTVRLLGVNRSGQEFKCVQEGSATSLGWGIFDGPTDLASVKAIASWHANAVRVPLNEDCWLGINGVNPSYAGAAYQAAIAGYVSTIHQAGLYVILDLHWNAPGTVVAGSQQPLPDADHAVDFWKSVATTFSSDQAVVFDLYNEPFLYGTYMQNSGGDPWDCWLNGCGLNQYMTGGNPYTQAYTWNTVGMQTLVNTIRAVGATNPLMVGGLDWANDLSGWLTHEPKDPLNAIIASWHSYPGETCGSASCWTSTVAPVALQVPVVTGEIGDNVATAATYVDSLLPWEDAHGISYVGWTWNAWGDSSNILIADYTGTPTANFGQKFHDHLVGLSP
jgi:endoglucanase